MTALERRSRRLLRAYPAAYRRERGEEIIGTLLEATPEDADLAAAARRPCADRGRSEGTRCAEPAPDHRREPPRRGDGRRLALPVRMGSDLPAHCGDQVPDALAAGSAWPALPAVLTGLAVAATVVLAWTAPRRVVLAGALPAAAAVCYFVLVRAHLTGPAVIQLASLAGLVALIPRTARPSRRWLWLLGVVMATALLPDLQTSLAPSRPCRQRR